MFIRYIQNFAKNISQLEIPMLKTIKKTLLLSLFIFSSCIFPSAFAMRRVAQAVVARTLNQAAPFRHSLAARCPSFFSGVIIPMAEESAKIDQVSTFHLNENVTMTTFESPDSFVAMDQEGGNCCTVTDQSLSDTELRDTLNQIEQERLANVNQNAQARVVDLNSKPEVINGQFHPAINNQGSSNFNKIKARDTVQGYVSSHGGSTVHDQQLQSHNDSINGRIANQDKQSAQHLSQMISNANAAATVKAIVANVKAQLIENIVNHSTNVRNEVSKMVGSCSSSQHDLQCLKAELNQPLPQLKTKFQSLCPSNSQIDFIVNPEKFGFKSNIPESWTKQDFDKAKEALTLKVEIESREAAIQAINYKFKQEEQAQNILIEKQHAQEVELAQEKQAQEALMSDNQLIESQHEACTFDLANCPDSGLEKHWSDRQDALFQTIDQGYLQYDQSFNLTPETCGFLAAHGIDYKNFQNFYGTALQQQLHQEMCDILSQAGLLQTEFGHSSNLVNSIVDVADAAYDANKSGQVLLASQLIDVDCGLFKLSHEISAAAMSYAQAAVSAVAHGTLDILHIPVDVFHIVAHPSETCKALGKTIGYVLQTAMLNDREILLANPEMFEPLRDQRNAEVAAELKNLGDKIADSSGPEIFEALLRFGTVAVVPEKILSAIGGVCGAVKAEVNIARAGELAAAAGEQVGAEKLAHKVAQAAQKMEQVAQESIAKSLAAELMEAEKVGVAASEARIATRSIAEVLTDIEKFGGKIPLSNVELCKEIETVIKQFIKETNCVIDQSLRQQFVSKWLFENGLKKRVSMDLNHILNYEVKFIKNKKLGMMEIEFSGGHLAGSTEALAETGLIKIINKQQLPTGCWKYDCIDIFTKEKFTKTEFHVSWSKDTIIQQSWNLFENSTISEYVAEGDKLAKYIKLGEQELSIVIKNYEKDINITTSVPYEIPKKKI
jgi:hypothetical protein